MSGDNYNVRNPLLDAPPIVLVPVSITRRRRTNAEEIGKSLHLAFISLIKLCADLFVSLEKEMSSMSSDFASLNADIEKARSLSKDSGALLQKASGHAEKIASAVYHASQYFMKRKWYVLTFFLIHAFGC